MSTVEQIIKTTDGHPFWVVTDEPDLDRAARSVVDENGIVLYHENLKPGLNGFWVEAKDLRVRDVFLGANGELSTLTNAMRVEQAGGIAVFNFSVEGNHNYFILAKEYEFGQTCVLVHNAWNYNRAFLTDSRDIRFTQLDIDTKISGPSGTIHNLRDSLANGYDPSNISPIRIYKDGNTGAIYSLDNRRLWAAKEADTLVNARWATDAEIHKAWGAGKSPAGITVNVRGQ